MLSGVNACINIYFFNFTNVKKLKKKTCSFRIFIVPKRKKKCLIVIFHPTHSVKALGNVATKKKTSISKNSFFN